MKVKDLKEKLEQFDEDKEVFITLNVKSVEERNDYLHNVISILK